MFKRFFFVFQQRTLACDEISKMIINSKEFRCFIVCLFVLFPTLLIKRVELLLILKNISNFMLEFPSNPSYVV